jgi:hypothetical protein
MKTQKNWVYDEKIYIHLRYMELCVCITDYNDIQKRALKDFWVILRGDTVTSETTSNEYTRQKISVFNVRVDSCMKN